MKQNYVFYFVAAFIICQVAYAMEEAWEQKAQDIKNFYNQATIFELEGKKDKALEWYTKINEVYFPLNTVTEAEKFKEIFAYKQMAQDKIEKLSKNKPPIKEENKDRTTIWSMLQFLKLKK